MMGDTEHGSWGSNELGGYIGRESSRSTVSYDGDMIALSNLPVWVYHNLLLDNGTMFEHKAEVLRTLRERERRRYV